MVGRLNDLGHGRVDVPKLDPADIVIREGYNYRRVDTEAVQKHIAWLVESIRAQGVQKPVEVEFIDGKAYVVDGECRVRACNQLRKEGVEILIPAIAVRGDEAEIRAKSMVANGALPPTQLEFGKAAEQLLAYGWTPERVAMYTPPHIAANAAKAVRYVKDAVDLQQAPLAVKKAVAEGVNGVAISPALALSATRKSRLLAPQIIEEAAKKAKESGKKTAMREKGDGKAAKAKHVERVQIEQEREFGDKMADLIMDSGETDTPLYRAARRWNKLRGR